MRSSWTREITSSIRAGLIRPSLINLTSARRATSLRIGSKQDKVTAWGVSSIIKSTPVAFSRAFILRPSRPINLPFISSDGRATVETVDSDDTSEAKRCIADAIISLALSEDSSLACSSASLYKTATSCWISIFACSISSDFASLWDKSASDSSFVKYPSFEFSSSSLSALTLELFSLTEFSLISNLLERISRCSSRLRRRCSVFCISFWRLRNSVWIDVRIFIASSLASINIRLRSSLVWLSIFSASPCADCLFFICIN